MMREYGLTQSQYEAIRDALIAQNVISATAGQAYAGAWEDLLYGDLAEYGVGYAPVLGNIYFAKKRKEAAASQAGAASGGVAAGGALPPGKEPGDKKNENDDIKAEDINWKGFSSEKNPETGLTKLQEHYQKHVIDGGEFGDISQNEYLRMAKEFAKEVNPNFLQKRVGNIIIKYDPVTRRMVIGNIKNRQIRSFYIADGRSPDPFMAAIEEALNKTKK